MEQHIKSIYVFKTLRLVVINKQSFKKQVSKQQFVPSIKMVNLSLNELKTIKKIRGIKAYKSISERRLLSVLN